MIRAEHPQLPVIVFTGVGFDEDILQEARRKGASSFVTKGLPMGNLFIRKLKLLRGIISAAPRPAGAVAAE